MENVSIRYIWVKWFYVTVIVGSLKIKYLIRNSVFFLFYNQFNILHCNEILLKKYKIYHKRYYYILSNNKRSKITDKILSIILWSNKRLNDFCDSFRRFTLFIYLFMIVWQQLISFIMTIYLKKKCRFFCCHCCM